MSKGINIAENVFLNKYASYSTLRKPVVFLSHKSEDKDYVEAIGNYFLNAGIDIYLDSSDFKLQTAVAMNDPKAITDCIQEGISKSDYILCFASKKTVMSWWVPYEIGYGKRAEKEIATLVRKDVENIPDYLKIEEILDDISDLNNLIKKVTSNHGIPLMEKYSWEDKPSNDFIEKPLYSHTLSKYLNL